MKIYISVVIGLIAGLICNPLMIVGAEADGNIAVDMDPFYKGLTGSAASSLIHGETVKASGDLADAVALSTTSGSSALGVGDVKPLYADGWRQFTLRAIGGNAEIWVANDLSYCPGDPRSPHEVTQEQIDYLFSELNDVIYSSNTQYFGYVNDRDGTGGLFAGYNLRFRL